MAAISALDPALVAAGSSVGANTLAKFAAALANALQGETNAVEDLTPEERAFGFEWANANVPATAAHWLEVAFGPYDSATPTDVGSVGAAMLIDAQATVEAHLSGFGTTQAAPAASTTSPASATTVSGATTIQIASAPPTDPPPTATTATAPPPQPTTGDVTGAAIPTTS